MTEQLYHFEDVESILNNEELKKMWNVLETKDLKLKNIRFSLHHGSGIGTNIFMVNKRGKTIEDITDYHSW